MILIATYDSDQQRDGEPRWHHRMQSVPTYWFLKMTGTGHSGIKAERSLRARKPCSYNDLRAQLIVPMLDEIREEVGGVVRFQFWVYKAR